MPTAAMLRRMQTHLTIITGSSRGLGAALVAQRLLPGHSVLGLEIGRAHV